MTIEDLKTHYRSAKRRIKAVDGISFGLEKAEALGLLGESGSGKTTVALSIMRLLPRNALLEGRILFKGEDLLAKTKNQMRKILWKEISIILQGALNSLNPVCRVGDQIVEPLILHKNLTKDEALNRVKELFELVGLDESRISSYPHELSGGMKQRVMIAMALSCNPALVIADEPTTALDVIVQGEIIDEIKDLQQRLKLSLIMISHDVAALMDVCDQIAVMYSGKIVEYSDAVTIFHKTAHPYSIELLRSVVSVRGPRRKLVSASRVTFNPLNMPSGCRFYPRCSYAKEVCQRTEPPLSEIRKGHYVACHRVGEIPLT